MATSSNEAGAASPRDLELRRVIDVPRTLVWAAWSDPVHVAKWWAPEPWTTKVIAFDLRPGGAFDTEMSGPDGGEFHGKGCFLDVVEKERVVFTDALEAGWRPGKESFMTAIITMADHAGGGTEYVARVLHKDEADAKKHEEMGFFDGWGTVIEQLGRVAAGLGPN